MREHDGRERLQLHEQVNAGVHSDSVEWEAEKLMHGGREAIILHNGERYRLRITSKQKLILTK